MREDTSANVADAEQVEADLARKLLRQTEEPKAVTRTAYHNHQSWRTGVLLHQKPACGQMTGRSELRTRTVELSADSSETIHHLCWNCQQTRPGNYRDILTRNLLRELIDIYPAGDRATAEHLARQLDRHAGTRVASRIEDRLPLPISSRLLDHIAYRTSLSLTEQQHTLLQQLTPAAAADGTLVSLCDLLAQTPASGRRRHIHEALARWWPDVPARSLRRELLGETGPPGPPQEDGRQDPYLLLEGRWQQRMQQLLEAQADIRRQHVLRRTHTGETVEIIILGDANVETAAEQAELPTSLLVLLEVMEVGWGESVSIWRTLRAVAELAQNGQHVAIVPAGVGPAPSEAAAMTLRYIAGGTGVAEAAELTYGTLLR